jgi:hypothetical protein
VSAAIVVAVLFGLLVLAGEAGARWMPRVDRFLDRMLSGGALTWRGDR